MTDRLALLTLEEVRDLRLLLLAVAEEHGPESAKAGGRSTGLFGASGPTFVGRLIRCPLRAWARPAA